MKSSSFYLHLILTVLAHMSPSIESCSPEEDKISVYVKTEFLEQSVLSAYTYTKTVSSSSSFKETVDQLAVSASASGGYGAFSASASASYESLKNEVTSSKNYEETEQEDKTEFKADQLQIIRDIQTTVTINGKSASVSERDFVTTVPVEESLSSSELNRWADVYMTEEFGEKAASNTFRETICQEKRKVAVSKISIKTGSFSSAASDCDAFLTICDMSNNCCDTSGLDNPYTNDREKDQLDTYTDTSQLYQCSMLSLVPSGQLTAQLVSSGSKKKGEWWVKWVRISAGESTYNCPVSGWLDTDTGRGAKGPTRRNVTCTRIDNLDVGAMC